MKTTGELWFLVKVVDVAATHHRLKMSAPEAVKKPILSRKELLTLLATSTVLGLIPILCQLLLGSPIDRRISLLTNIGMILGTGWTFLLGLVSVIGSLFALLSKSHRRLASKVLLVNLCIVVFIFIGLKERFAIRTQQFEDLAERSKPLIAAISRYEKDSGKAPDKLDSLVPKYLTQIPHTGMGAYPDYEYKVGLTEPGLDAAWELSVPCSVGMLNWDVFYYVPTEKYPEYNYGGYIEPIKSWAYVHE